MGGDEGRMDCLMVNVLCFFLVVAKSEIDIFEGLPFPLSRNSVSQTDRPHVGKRALVEGALPRVIKY